MSLHAVAQALRGVLWAHELGSTFGTVVLEAEGRSVGLLIQDGHVSLVGPEAYRAPVLMHLSGTSAELVSFLRGEVAPKLTWTAEPEFLAALYMYRPRTQNVLVPGPGPA